MSEPQLRTIATELAGLKKMTAAIDGAIARPQGVTVIDGSEADELRFEHRRAANSVDVSFHSKGVEVAAFRGVPVGDALEDLVGTRNAKAIVAGADTGTIAGQALTYEHGTSPDAAQRAAAEKEDMKTAGREAAKQAVLRQADAEFKKTIPDSDSRQQALQQLSERLDHRLNQGATLANRPQPARQEPASIRPRVADQER